METKNGYLKFFQERWGRDMRTLNYNTNIYSADKPLLPERNLLAALLHRAWLDLHEAEGESKYSNTKLGENGFYRKQLHNWFRSKSLQPFSFRWVCQQLTLDPEHTLRFFSEHKYSLIEEQTKKVQEKESEKIYELLAA